MWFFYYLNRILKIYHKFIINAYSLNKNAKYSKIIKTYCIQRNANCYVFVIFIKNL